MILEIDEGKKLHELRELFSHVNLFSSKKLNLSLVFLDLAQKNLFKSGTYAYERISSVRK